MLKIIFFVAIFVIVMFSIILTIIINSKNRKTNIYEYSVNDYYNIDFKSLSLVISTCFDSKLKLIVIQDDIDFKDSKFYWPKHCIYIHMSDAQKISSEQFISNLFLSPLENNLRYLKNVVFIR